MALVLLDRAKETTTVVGTGTATLLGAVTSYQSLAGVGNGNTTYYCIVDQVGANWEVGIGTYTSAGTTLARTTVLASSNAGALVVFTTGVKDVFVTYPSEKGVWYGASGNVLFTGTTTAANLAYTGTLTGSTGILNIGSGQLYKDVSGNVGIGTSSPSATLHVAGNVAVNTPLATWNSAISVVQVANASFWNNNLTTIIGSNIVYSAGYAATRIAGTYSAAIGFNADGVGSIDFTTYGTGLAGAALTGSPAMRIDASGNVGIGTSSPACRLNVVSGTNNGIQVYDGTVNTLIYNTGSNTSVIGTNSNHPLALYTNNTERMRIDVSGQQSSTIVGFSGTYTEYKCRAWVNFNGSGTVAIRASGNVSSITDNGTADYTVNFTTAMPDANYSISGTAGLNTTSLKVVVQPYNLTAPTTSAVRIQCPQVDGALSNDPPIVCVSIFR